MFKKSTLLIAGLSALLAAALTFAADQASRPVHGPKAAQIRTQGPQWWLAVSGYTFNRFTLSEAIDKTKELHAHFLEAYAWEKVSPNHGNMTFNCDMPAAVIEEVKKKLADSEVRIPTYYSNDIGKDPAQTKRLFEFCKNVGVRVIVAEPDPKDLPAIDKLAQEYKVKVAIHNHPKNPKDPKYTNWNPDNVMKLLEGRSKWIGCCADNGHWARSGLDSVECIKKCKGRLICMHLKDVNTMGPEAHDVPYGKGVIDLRALLTELKNEKFSGVFSIEYEHNMDNNTKDVGQCIAWFNKTKADLGIK